MEALEEIDNYNFVGIDETIEALGVVSEFLSSEYLAPLAEKLQSIADKAATARQQENTVNR